MDSTLATMSTDSPSRRSRSTRRPLPAGLWRPLLVMGAERELVGANAVLFLVLLIGVPSLWAKLLGLLVFLGGHFGIRLASKKDSQMFRTFIRSIPYQDFYPARPSTRANPRTVPEFRSRL